MKLYFILLVLLIPFSMASFGYNYLETGEKIVSGGNYTIDVNNTHYWQGQTPDSFNKVFEMFGGKHIKFKERIPSGEACGCDADVCNCQLAIANTEDCGVSIGTIIEGVCLAGTCQFPSCDFTLLPINAINITEREICFPDGTCQSTASSGIINGTMIYDTSDLLSIDPVARILYDTDGGTGRINWNDIGAVGYIIDFYNQYAVMPLMYDPAYSSTFDISGGVWYDVGGQSLDLRSGTLGIFNFVTGVISNSINLGIYDIQAVKDITSSGLIRSLRYLVGTFSNDNSVYMDYAPYGVITGNIIPSNEFTESVWIYPTGTIAEDYHELFVSNVWNDNQWIIQTDGEIQWYNPHCPSAVITTSDAGITANNWYHLLLTKNSSGYVRMYKNNVELTMSGHECAGDQGNGNMYIGRRDDGNHRFRGKMDEIGWWNTSLNTSEISTIYASGNGLYLNSTNTPQYNSLLAGYHFDESGTLTSATDWRGGNTMTYYGSPYVSTGKIISGLGVADTGEQVLVVGNITASEILKGNDLIISKNITIQGSLGITGQYNCTSYPNVTIKSGIITSWSC